MTDAIDNRILYAVFCLSRDTMAIDASSLGRVCHVSATDAAGSLVKLERAGLVDASRARLTMLGLAKAAAAGADLGGTGLDLSQARPAAPPVRDSIAAAPSLPAIPAIPAIAAIATATRQ